MHALDGHVRGQDQFMSARDLDQRGIVTDAQTQAAVGALCELLKPAYELRFASEHVV
jgi:hypothetical protein